MKKILIFSLLFVFATLLSRGQDPWVVTSNTSTDYYINFNNNSNSGAFFLAPSARTVGNTDEYDYRWSGGTGPWAVMSYVDGSNNAWDRQGLGTAQNGDNNSYIEIPYGVSENLFGDGSQLLDASRTTTSMLALDGGSTVSEVFHSRLNIPPGDDEAIKLDGNLNSMTISFDWRTDFEYNSRILDDKIPAGETYTQTPTYGFDNADVYVYIAEADGSNPKIIWRDDFPDGEYSDWDDGTDYASDLEINTYITDGDPDDDQWEYPVNTHVYNAEYGRAKDDKDPATAGFSVGPVWWTTTIEFDQGDLTTYAGAVAGDYRTVSVWVAYHYKGNSSGLNTANGEFHMDNLRISGTEAEAEVGDMDDEVRIKPDGFLMFHEPGLMGQACVDFPNYQARGEATQTGASRYTYSQVPISQIAKEGYTFGVMVTDSGEVGFNQPQFLVANVTKTGNYHNDGNYLAYGEIYTVNESTSQSNSTFGDYGVPHEYDWETNGLWNRAHNINYTDAMSREGGSDDYGPVSEEQGFFYGIDPRVPRDTIIISLENPGNITTIPRWKPDQDPTEVDPTISDNILGLGEYEIKTYFLDENFRDNINDEPMEVSTQIIEVTEDVLAYDFIPDNTILTAFETINEVGEGVGKRFHVLNEDFMSSVRVYIGPYDFVEGFELKVKITQLSGCEIESPSNTQIWCDRFDLFEDLELPAAGGWIDIPLENLGVMDPGTYTLWLVNERGNQIQIGREVYKDGAYLYYDGATDRVEGFNLATRWIFANQPPIFVSSPEPLYRDGFWEVVVKDDCVTTADNTYTVEVSDEDTKPGNLKLNWEFFDTDDNPIDLGEAVKIDTVPFPSREQAGVDVPEEYRKTDDFSDEYNANRQYRIRICASDRLGDYYVRLKATDNDLKEGYQRIDIRVREQQVNVPVDCDDLTDLKWENDAPVGWWVDACCSSKIKGWGYEDAANGAVADDCVTVSTAAIDSNEKDASVEAELFSPLYNLVLDDNPILAFTMATDMLLNASYDNPADYENAFEAYADPAKGLYDLADLEIWIGVPEDNGLVNWDEEDAGQVDGPDLIWTEDSLNNTLYAGNRLSLDRFQSPTAEEFVEVAVDLPYVLANYNTKYSGKNVQFRIVYRAQNYIDNTKPENNMAAGDFYIDEFGLFKDNSCGFGVKPAFDVAIEGIPFQDAPNDRLGDIHRTPNLHYFDKATDGINYTFNCIITNYEDRPLWQGGKVTAKVHYMDGGVAKVYREDFPLVTTFDRLSAYGVDGYQLPLTIVDADENPILFDKEYVLGTDALDSVWVDFTLTSKEDPNDKDDDYLDWVIRGRDANNAYIQYDNFGVDNGEGEAEADREIVYVGTEEIVSNNFSFVIDVNNYGNGDHYASYTHFDVAQMPDVDVAGTPELADDKYTHYATITDPLSCDDIRNGGSIGEVFYIPSTSTLTDTKTYIPSHFEFYLNEAIAEDVRYSIALVRGTVALDGTFTTSEVLLITGADHEDGDYAYNILEAGTQPGVISVPAVDHKGDKLSALTEGYYAVMVNMYPGEEFDIAMDKPRVPGNEGFWTGYQYSAVSPTGTSVNNTLTLDKGIFTIPISDSDDVFPSDDDFEAVFGSCANSANFLTYTDVNNYFSGTANEKAAVVTKMNSLYPGGYYYFYVLDEGLEKEYNPNVFGAIDPNNANSPVVYVRIAHGDLHLALAFDNVEIQKGCPYFISDFCGTFQEDPNGTVLCDDTDRRDGYFRDGYAYYKTDDERNFVENLPFMYRISVEDCSDDGAGIKVKVLSAPEWIHLPTTNGVVDSIVEVYAIDSTRVLHNNNQDTTWIKQYGGMLTNDMSVDLDEYIGDNLVILQVYDEDCPQDYCKNCDNSPAIKPIKIVVRPEQSAIDLEADLFLFDNGNEVASDESFVNGEKVLRYHDVFFEPFNVVKATDGTILTANAELNSGDNTIADPKSKFGGNYDVAKADIHQNFVAEYQIFLPRQMDKEDGSYWNVAPKVGDDISDGIDRVLSIHKRTIDEDICDDCDYCVEQDEIILSRCFYLPKIENDDRETVRLKFDWTTDFFKNSGGVVGTPYSGNPVDGWNNADITISLRYATTVNGEVVETSSAIWNETEGALLNGVNATTDDDYKASSKGWDGSNNPKWLHTDLEIPNNLTGQKVMLEIRYTGKCGGVFQIDNMNVDIGLPEACPDLYVDVAKCNELEWSKIPLRHVESTNGYSINYLYDNHDNAADITDGDEKLQAWMKAWINLNGVEFDARSIILDDPTTADGIRIENGPLAIAENPAETYVFDNFVPTKKGVYSVGSEIFLNTERDEDTDNNVYPRAGAQAFNVEVTENVYQIADVTDMSKTVEIKPEHITDGSYKETGNVFRLQQDDYVEKILINIPQMAPSDWSGYNNAESENNGDDVSPSEIEKAKVFFSFELLDANDQPTGTKFYTKDYVITEDETNGGTIGGNYEFLLNRGIEAGNYKVCAWVSPNHQLKIYADACGNPHIGLKFSDPELMRVSESQLYYDVATEGINYVSHRIKVWNYDVDVLNGNAYDVTWEIDLPKDGSADWVKLVTLDGDDVPTDYVAGTSTDVVYLAGTPTIMYENYNTQTVILTATDNRTGSTKTIEFEIEVIEANAYTPAAACDAAANGGICDPAAVDFGLSEFTKEHWISKVDGDLALSWHEEGQVHNTYLDVPENDGEWTKLSDDATTVTRIGGDKDADGLDGSVNVHQDSWMYSPLISMPVTASGTVPGTFEEQKTGVEVTFKYDYPTEAFGIVEVYLVEGDTYTNGATLLGKIEPTTDDMYVTNGTYNTMSYDITDHKNKTIRIAFRYASDWCQCEEDQYFVMKDFCVSTFKRAPLLTIDDYCIEGLNEYRTIPEGHTQSYQATATIKNGKGKYVIDLPAGETSLEVLVRKDAPYDDKNDNVHFQTVVVDEAVAEGAESGVINIGDPWTVPGNAKKFMAFMGLSDYGNSDIKENNANPGGEEAWEIWGYDMFSGWNPFAKYLVNTNGVYAKSPLDKRDDDAFLSFKEGTDIVSGSYGHKFRLMDKAYLNSIRVVLDNEDDGDKFNFSIYKENSGTKTLVHTTRTFIVNTALNSDVIDGQQDGYEVGAYSDAFYHVYNCRLVDDYQILEEGEYYVMINHLEGDFTIGLDTDYNNYGGGCVNKGSYYYTNCADGNCDIKEKTSNGFVELAIVLKNECPVFTDVEGILPATGLSMRTGIDSDNGKQIRETATVGVQYETTFFVEDPEGEAFTSFTIGNSSDESFVFTPDLTVPGYASGTLVFTPNAFRDYWVTLKAVDAAGCETCYKFSIFPQDGKKPSFITQPEIAGITDHVYSYTAVAIDPYSKDTLDITAVKMPTGMTATPNTDKTMTLTWTPATAGDFNVTLASTNYAGTTEQIFDIDVFQNVAPEIAPLADLNLVVGESFNVTASAYDANDENVTITVTGPDWVTSAQESGNSAIIMGTAVAAGTYSVTVTAADEAGLAAEKAETFTIYVDGDGETPTLTMEDITVKIDAAFEMPVIAEDPNGDYLTFSIVEAPDWASLLTVDNNNAVIKGYVGTYVQAGDYPVTVKVTDGMNDATASATITVGENTAPTIELSGDNSATIDATDMNSSAEVTFTLSVEDADGDDLEVFISGLPQWLEVTSDLTFEGGAGEVTVTGVITNEMIEGAEEFSGVVKATVTDGVATASDEFEFTVTITGATTDIKPEGVFANTIVKPNPTNGKVIITNVSNAKVFVIDMTGRVVKAKHNNVGGNAELDLSGLRSGTYNVKVVKDNDVFNARVILIK